MSNYALNTDMAREGSGSAGGKVQETGPYKGVIEWAREKQNQNNTSMIELKFVSVDNQYSNITIYTANNQGEHLHGMSQVHALMACLKVRSMSAVQGEVEAYDFDTSQVTKQKSMVLPELANKPIGLFLQKEHYINGKGEPKEMMNLFAPFTVDTEQLAKEVLDNKGEKGALMKLVEHVKDKVRNGASAPTPQTNNYQAPANNAADDFDDSEIPF